MNFGVSILVSVSFIRGVCYSLHFHHLRYEPSHALCLSFTCTRYTSTLLIIELYRSFRWFFPPHGYIRTVRTLSL